MFIYIAIFIKLFENLFNYFFMFDFYRFIFHHCDTPLLILILQCFQIVVIQRAHDFHLRVEFNDGSVKDVNCKSLLSLPAFKPLADPAVFKQLAIDHGVVTWLDGDIDVAPEWLFDHGTNYTYPAESIEEPSVAEEQAIYGRK